MSICPILVLAWAWAAPAPTLDAGTWVRPSLSVLPVAVARCHPASSGEMLREWKEEHPSKGGKKHPNPPAESRLEEMARQRDRVCEEVRLGTETGGKRWTGLPALRRFDSNPLPEDLEQELTIALEKGMGKLEDRLPRLASPLREDLAAAAVDRARHLESDFQKNSMVAEKAHEEDIVSSQTRRMRNAGWVLAQRVEDLRLSRRRGAWFVEGTRTLGAWRFDPEASLFRRKALWDERFQEEVVDPSRASAAAFGAGGFDSRLLSLEDFRFTAQLESCERGLRPSGRIASDTEADLRSGRRFVYRERVLEPDGATRVNAAGYGFLESGEGTSWTLRHIGGRDPYDGMVVQELPGDGWAVLGLERTPWERGGPAPSGGPRAELDGHPVAWTLFGGWRRNAPGDLPGQSLFADLSGSWVDLSGALRDRSATGSSSRSLDAGLSVGCELGWIGRWNLRRLFLEGGGGVGLRWLAIPLGSVRDSGEVSTAASFGDATRLSCWQPHLDVLGGVQWSITPGSGIGLRCRWEAWREEPQWTAASRLGDFRPAQGGFGPGRFSLSLEWVGG